MPPALVIEEAVRLSQANVQEIVLTGIEISSYGRDLPEKINLTELIARLCEAVPHTYIRLGSLEPRTIDAEFCSRLQRYPNLRPHFHLSLQSGCDRILERMKRRYTTAFFAERCAMLRAEFSGLLDYDRPDRGISRRNGYRFRADAGIYSCM